VPGLIRFDAQSELLADRKGNFEKAGEDVRNQNSTWRLVHGAWADGSSWDAIARQRNRVVLLRERAGTGQKTP
jgi:hypothetical protein